MKKMFQKIHDYKFDGRRGDDKIHREKSSFGTLEAAIENANMWINKTESWIDTTVVKIVIIRKDTNEILWSYEA